MPRDVTGWQQHWRIDLPLPRRPNGVAAYDDRVVGAFKALARGEAEPHQQTLALEWLVWMTGKNHPSYHDSDRDTAFREGMRWVGLQVVNMVARNTKGAD